MKIEDFKEKHIEKILELWEKYIRISPSFVKPLMILEDIKDGRGNYGQIREGYRIGSKWTPSSKLRFKVYYRTKEAIPYFHDNMNRNNPNLKEAERAGTKFNEAITKYLEGQSS